MTDWPASLPPPLYHEISIGAPLGVVLRTDMDFGPAKQRRRFTAAPRPVSLVFEPVTQEGVADFDQFFVEDIQSGTLAFEMLHPITDEPRMFRFIGGDEPWLITPVGVDAFRITTAMELLP